MGQSSYNSFGGGGGGGGNYWQFDGTTLSPNPATLPGLEAVSIMVGNYGLELTIIKAFLGFQSLTASSAFSVTPSSLSVLVRSASSGVESGLTASGGLCNVGINNIATNAASLVSIASDAVSLFVQDALGNTAETVQRINITEVLYAGGTVFSIGNTGAIDTNQLTVVSTPVPLVFSGTVNIQGIGGATHKIPFI